MKGFIRFGVALILWSTFAALQVEAQAQAQDAFSSASIGISAGEDVSEARFQRLWDASPAVGMSVRMPFHVGDIEIGAVGMLNRFDEEASVDVTDGASASFAGALLFAGWGLPIVDSPRLVWRGAALAGDYLMVFEDRVHGYSKHENELAVGAETTVLVRLTRRVGIEAALSFTRIFTSTPLDLLHVSGGVRYRLAVPEWLQTLLR